MKLRVLFVVIITICCSQTFFAQEKFSAKVKVEISASQSINKDEIYSYFTRELRSLGDVTVVSNSEDYTIAVMIINLPTVNNQETGYAMSVILAKTVRCGSSKNTEETSSKDKYDDFLNQYISTIRKDDLRKEIGKIVTNFDTKILEPNR